ncbi:UDP-N-acetylglucosamine 2-epimerase (non-hydrolyzing) [bacterium]|nr:UDP-N-acetylglucosamine 2-epimerase (non-hydrolyzing) [bacterium]
MKKIFIVIGTRPESIKMVPVIRALRLSSIFEVVICITGQHRELLDPMLKFFNIEPNIDLGVIKKDISLSDLSADIFRKISVEINLVKPDLVLVQGDTTSAYVAAMASFYQKVRVGHIEAGLRSYNSMSPWPEEMNRRLITQLASFHFCPTESARENLLKEGVSDLLIFVTGNTVVDSLLATIDRLEKDHYLRKKCLRNIEKAGYKIFLDRGGVENCWVEDYDSCASRSFVLITGHRRENFNNELDDICEAIRCLSLKFPFLDFVYPVHLNPLVQKKVRTVLSGISNIYLTDHLDYPSFILLMKNCKFIMTDSGGVQEEASCLKKFVLVLRNDTERLESVEAGVSQVIKGLRKGDIIEKVSDMIDHIDGLVFSGSYEEVFVNVGFLFGNGNSGRMISDRLEKLLDS